MDVEAFVPSVCQCNKYRNQHKRYRRIPGRLDAQVRCLTLSSYSTRHDWTGPTALIGALSSWKIPSLAENKVCIIGWTCCQVIYSQFGLAIHQNDHQARRRFVEWAQNVIAVVPDFHKRILFSDEAHFWLNGYVNKQNCRIWSEANPQVYVETPLHPEKLTVWCALWADGILL
ncbi:hypothetical protein TNCV_1332761 [Trichonephila clavipes]|nr:hypothetical protein TNCV_1332761 [Trichonephila clavipes]